MEEYATVQWNAAIEAAAESADVKRVFSVAEDEFVPVVNKQSILKLKK